MITFVFCVVGDDSICLIMVCQRQFHFFACHVILNSAPKEANHRRERIIVGVITGSTIALISGMLLAFCYMRRRSMNLAGTLLMLIIKGLTV